MKMNHNYGIWSKPRRRIDWGWYPVVLLAGMLIGSIGTGLVMSHAYNKIAECNGIYPVVIPNDLDLDDPDALGEAYDSSQSVIKENLTDPGVRKACITCYKPPDFPLEDVTASGLTIASALMLATSLKCDGIAAVSPDLYEMSTRIRTGSYAQVMVKTGTAQGLYLIVDRTASHLSNTIDVWTDRPDQWCYWSEYAYINPLVEATK